ncbi:hypothetical protein D3C84_1259680 [compost metagenome]
MILADMRMGADSLRHPKQPLIHIQRMRTLVYQNAAAFARPCRAPAAAVVISLGTEHRRVDPSSANQLPQLAAV